MLFRILELCLTLIVLTLTLKEIILPLVTGKPLFQLTRSTFKKDSK